ncbi:MAG: roadblock/LC7 domain-containing protein [Verrucomicrobia bacterium]|nr:roadblock/LC7 domain-containing protein [Verrucomicrobiota bacterium]
MPTLPQLIEEDIRQLDQILKELLASSEATTALIIDKGGFLITHKGESEEFDLTTIAALASGAYMANQTIANLVRENNFNSVYQQGENFSMFASNIDEHCLLVVIFKASVSVGAVKYYAISAGARVADQLKLAHQRDPNASLDLSVLNLTDTSSVFRKKSA